MRHPAVKLCTALCLCFLLFLPAYASSIPPGTYSLTGVLVGSSSLSGTITLDSSGLATAASLTYANAAYSSPTFTTIASKGTSGNNPLADFAYISGSNGQVTLYYFDTLNPSGGITLCEAGSGCTVASSLQIYSPNYQANLTGGSLTSAAASTSVTPEPPTWVLALTGLLMVAAVWIVRRRSRAALPAPTGAIDL